MEERGHAGGVLEARSDAVGDGLLGLDDSVGDRQSRGDAGGDRGGEGASGAVDELVVDLARTQRRHGLTVEEDVDRVLAGQARTALDDDVLRPLTVDDLRSFDHALDGLDRLDAGEDRCLFEVRGDDGGQRHEVLDEEVLEVDHRPRSLAHEDRVEDVGQLIGLEILGEDERGFDGAEHARLDRIELVDGKRRTELAVDDFGLDEVDDVTEVVVRVEGDDAGDDAVPNAPYSSNIFRSASSPAPPETSEPAIVSSLAVMVVLSGKTLDEKSTRPRIRADAMLRRSRSTRSSRG